MARVLHWLNLSLLLLFPVAWVAPLLRAGVNLPLFGTHEISVISGITVLWPEEWLLSLLLIAFALVAPMAKTIGLALLHMGRLNPRWKPLFATLAKLAMADIFLIALYIVVLKGVMLAKVQTGWGLYLFTFCVLASLAASLVPPRLSGARE